MTDYSTLNIRMISLSLPTFNFVEYLEFNVERPAMKGEVGLRILMCQMNTSNTVS